DLAGDGRDQKVAAQADAGVLQRLHRLDVAGERALHVGDAESVDAAVPDEALGLEARNAGQPGLAAGVRRVHVTVEHQALAVPRALEQPDHVGPALLHLLPGDLHPQRAQYLAHVLAYRLLAPRRAGDGDELERKSDQPFL